MSVSFCKICQSTVRDLKEHLNTEHFLPQWGEFSLETYEQLFGEKNVQANQTENIGSKSTANHVLNANREHQMLMIPVAKEDYEFIDKAAEALMIVRNNMSTLEIKTQREKLFKEHNSSN